MGGKGARARPGCLPGELELSASAPPALFILRLPFFGFPALVISCLWPDISPGQMQGDYNEDLCVF